MESTLTDKQTIIRNLDAYQIQQYQRNRYPCFFVDVIEEAIPGKSARGYKNFTYNEWFFPAHFEDEPNVPGFIQIETLTQVFLMTFLTIPENKGKKTGFIAVRDARFKKKVIPGDRLEVEAELKFFRRGLAKGISKGYVDGTLCCSADLEIAVPDIMRRYRPRTETSENVSGGGKDRILIISCYFACLALVYLEAQRNTKRNHGSGCLM